MNTRVVDRGFFIFEQSKRGGARKVLVILLIISGLMLYVGGKVKIVRLGYQIEALEREKKELERANASLRIEASSLSSSARIEELAIKKLGMIRPSKDSVVIVKRKAAEANSSAWGSTFK